jgi:hypothetical protein
VIPAGFAGALRHAGPAHAGHLGRRPRYGSQTPSDLDIADFYRNYYAKLTKHPIWQ